MSWHYLQGLEEASWGDTCLDGAPDALLNLMPTPAACCCNGKPMDCSKDSQYGTTCGPSTDAPGVAGSMLSAAASPAPTLATADSRLELPENGRGFGAKWQGSFAKWDRDLFLWKTSQACLIEEWATFSGRWPRWGLMRDGECWEAPIPEARRFVSAPGLWPTLKASDAEQYTKNAAYFERRKSIAPDLPVVVALNTPPTPGGYYGRLNPEWTEWLMGWPTGWTALDAKATGKIQEQQRQHGVF